MTTMIQNGKHVVRVGSRTSALALTQTHLVMEMLLEKHCELQFELVTMDTIGDLILDKELSKIGDKSLFTKELELALQERVVDLVVHSLKDVPTSLDDQFVLGCVCSRVGCEDAVVMRAGSVYERLEDLPEGSLVGTSSVRRVAQLTHRYPRLNFVSVRGNLHTRLRKLDGDEEGRLEAIILARAGLERLGWQQRMTQVLDEEDCLYAVGQGALACECRAEDLVTLRLLASIHDERAALTALSERSLMRCLDGGCSTPIAVRSSLSKGVLGLRALVMSVDGRERVEDALEMLLPEETAENGLSNGHGNHLSNGQKFKGGRPRRLAIAAEEEAVARDQTALFTGLRVHPICEVGRLRMAASQRLGTELAERLLDAGARAILGVIVRNETVLAKPVAI